MKTLYKWRFKTPVHFGTEKGILSDTKFTLHADTVFSALLQEALKYSGVSGLESLVKEVKDNRLRITDTFPWLETSSEERFFIPTPILSDVPFFKESTTRKNYKKLAYIPASELNNFVHLTDDPPSHKKVQHLSTYNHFGESDLRISVNLQSSEDARPYSVNTWHFSGDSGLYVIIETEDSRIQELLHDLMKSLGHTGIGGKRNVGLGEFEVDDPIDLADPYVEDLEVLAEKTSKLNAPGPLMTLSTTLPMNSELETALQNATYQIVRRGGFTDSSAYANTWMRKRDLYLLRSGSVFHSFFEGDIYDVSDKGRHPIYRYAKPFFMEVPI